MLPPEATPIGRNGSVRERCGAERSGWLLRALAFVLAASLVSLTGCTGSLRSPGAQSGDNGFFGWHVHAPFDTSEVKTVAVFFKTNSFRRDIEKQLTEAVIKEIILRTPYRVVGKHEDADSLLTGVINFSDKNLIVEAPTNFARELNASIMVQTYWTHNPPTDIERQRPPTIVAETVNFVPEVGETSLSGFNHVVQSIAKQIVDMMEQPWFLDEDLK
jgi:Lipopolysaccharide-assembly